MNRLFLNISFISLSACSAAFNKDGSDVSVDTAPEEVSDDSASEPQTSASEEDCSDGLDDDEDGLLDCEDPDCADNPICQTEDNCTDGADNDQDGLFDCDDPDCADDSACINDYEGDEPGECSDGLDNDENGLLDCADPNCEGSPDCEEVCWSLYFDGDDDYVGVPDSDSWAFGTNDFTLSASIYISSITNHVEMIGQFQDESNHWHFMILSNQLKFAIKEGGSWNPLGIDWTPTLNDWHHLAVVRDNDELNFYHNGTLLDSISDFDSSIPNFNGDLSFGRYKDLSGSDLSIDGNLDNIEIWNRALGQPEIQDNISTPPSGSETGLVGLWTFDEGSGATTADSTGNGHDATIYGATWTGECPSQ